MDYKWYPDAIRPLVPPEDLLLEDEIIRERVVRDRLILSYVERRRPGKHIPV